MRAARSVGESLPIASMSHFPSFSDRLPLWVFPLPDPLWGWSVWPLAVDPVQVEPLWILPLPLVSSIWGSLRADVRSGRVMLRATTPSTTLFIKGRVRGEKFFHWKSENYSMLCGDCNDAHTIFTIPFLGIHSGNRASYAQESTPSMTVRTINCGITFPFHIFFSSSPPSERIFPTPRADWYMPHHQ